MNVRGKGGDKPLDDVIFEGGGKRGAKVANGRSDERRKESELFNWVGVGKRCDAEGRAHVHVVEV